MSQAVETSSKLSVKDLVLIGVLGAAAAVVCMVIGIVCGLSPSPTPSTRRWRQSPTESSTC